MSDKTFAYQGRVSALSDGRLILPRRCEVTKNLCGTDTWSAGQACTCVQCHAWIVEELDRRAVAIRDLLLDGAAVRAERDRLAMNEGALLGALAHFVDSGGTATWDDVLTVASGVGDRLAAAHAALREAEAEVARLSGIVIHHQAEQKRLEVANDRLKVEYAERGKVNADLNKRLQRALSTPEGM